ncbi:MAG: Pyruvate dehydrogenase E1 component subunit alpha [Chlamydiae bacterium]|nr:Pyruvate dehydrogenase E1 component subunit alpha [Chlamydiota bacterium]
MEFETLQYLDEKGNLTEGYTPSVSDDVVLEAYKKMVVTRHVDERMLTLQRQGAITFSMSSLGEECCSVATAAALEKDDWVYPQYREVGVLFWRGFLVQDFVHQMFGDAEDLGKGRQMPNHFGCRELNVVTVSSPIATKIPHAAGCGYAMKLQKESNISAVFFGDGATSEGDFHAGINFAAVLEAPTLFFCRNNRYAISTGLENQFHSDGVAPKGEGYGVKTYKIDGNDFFAVFDTVREARKHCLEKGPVLIEAMTYRMGAHSTSDDPSVYRTKEEEEQWKDKDPLLRLRLYLEKQGIWSDSDEKKLWDEVKQEVTEAIRVAKETPKPELKSLVEDVYEEIPETLQRQYEELKMFFPEED